MVETLRRVVDSNRFQTFVTFVILLAAVLVGIETYPSAVARYGDVLHALDKVVLGVFVLEIVMKMGAEGKRPWRYFRDPWNVFDFAIVAFAFMPVGSQYVTVLRLARLLRVLRLVHAVPRLQILVGALLKSVPSMGYVSLLLLLIFYVYAVAGVFLFGQNDPFRFGSLQIALVTLFQVATAEDWSTTLYTQMYGCTQAGYEGREALCTAPSASPVLAPFYFISFILIGTMVILNLFIGVIMNGMEEAQEEAAEQAERRRIETGDKRDAQQALNDDLLALEKQVLELQGAIRSVAVRAQARREVGSG
ncbi:MAG TPA: ion transporter [Polyangiaceae bacterium]|jgi:voltage-gated sodium channel|nr:ion transporter [Polyangiaceae bacterium]